MCTVSWIRQAGGYRLLCSRDEKHTRQMAPAARRPRAAWSPVHRAAETAGGGGTWIGVNQFGLSLCLLNRYQNDAVPSAEAGSYLNRFSLFDLHAPQ